MTRSAADLEAVAWDYIVVGGGSAGSVVANRLSTRSENKVLLIEAGRDVLADDEPADIQDPYPYHAAFNPDYHWNGLTARFGTRPTSDEPPKRYEQARVLGGGSSINGLLANRGTPDDYDGWAAAGAKGWEWKAVLPYFRRLETDLDMADPEMHGNQGPIQISRVPERDWPGFSVAASEAFAAAQFRKIDDQNGSFEDGWFPLAVSSDGQRRISTARGYLTAEVRQRTNLTILTDRTVHRVLFNNRRATGVELSDLVVRGREVILCAGALMSPALLQRSGIGPGGLLKALGISVVRDSIGVGSNLHEHPSIALSALLRPGNRMGRLPRRHVHVGLRYSSGMGAASDMFVVAVARTAWHPLGSRIGTLFGWVNKPLSTGSVRLRSEDPKVYPEVDFALMSDPADLVRMKVLFRQMAQFFLSPALSAVTTNPFAATHGALAAMVREPTFRNRLLTLGPALMADGPDAIRRSLVSRLLAPGFDFEATLDNEVRLEEVIRAHTICGWHPCGTCRMGPTTDPHAVVDPETARVHGVDGLRVIDASVMPSVPRANTNIPTIMVAEKFAAAILVNG